MSDRQSPDVAAPDTAAPKKSFGGRRASETAGRKSPDIDGPAVAFKSVGRRASAPLTQTGAALASKPTESQSARGLTGSAKGSPMADTGTGSPASGNANIAAKMKAMQVARESAVSPENGKASPSRANANSDIASKMKAMKEARAAKDPSSPKSSGSTTISRQESSGSSPRKNSALGRQLTNDTAQVDSRVSSMGDLPMEKLLKEPSSPAARSTIDEEEPPSPASPTGSGKNMVQSARGVRERLMNGDRGAEADEVIGKPAPYKPSAFLPARPSTSGGTAYFMKGGTAPAGKGETGTPKAGAKGSTLGQLEAMSEPSSPKSKRQTSTGVTLSHDGEEEILCVRFSPDSAHIALAFADGGISICSATSGKQVSKLNTSSKSNGLCPTTMVRFRPPRAGEDATQERLVSVGSDGRIMQFHPMTRRRYFEKSEEPNQLFCIEYRSDGQQFATAGKLAEMNIYDEETQKQVQVLRGGDVTNCSGHSNRILSLKYHPKMPHVLMSGSWDRMLQFWDTREGNAVRCILGPYICGDSMDISDDGDTVLTGSSRPDKQLQLWNFGSGRLLQTIASTWPADTSCQVLAAQFSKHDNNNTIVAGGSGSSVVKLYDGKCDWQNFGNIDLGVDAACYAVDFAPNGSMVAVAGTDKCVRVVKLA